MGAASMDAYPPRGERFVSSPPSLPTYSHTHIAFHEDTRVEISEEGVLTLSDPLGDVSLSLALDAQQLEQMHAAISARLQWLYMEAGDAVVGG